MAEVKVFRIAGEITHPKMKTKFVKELRALKPEHAVEQVYSDMGSRHKLKRCHIKILKVEEVSPEEAEDLTIRQLAGAE